jgi:hypothetical protein
MFATHKGFNERGRPLRGFYAIDHLSHAVKTRGCCTLMRPKIIKKCPFSKWNRPEPSAKFIQSEGRVTAADHRPSPHLPRFLTPASTYQSKALALQPTSTKYDYLHQGIRHDRPLLQSFSQPIIPNRLPSYGTRDCYQR